MLFRTYGNQMSCKAEKKFQDSCPILRRRSRDNIVLNVQVSNEVTNDERMDTFRLLR
jgi:hypothetical protein